jgi:hypothetical protein
MNFIQSAPRVAFAIATLLLFQCAGQSEAQGNASEIASLAPDSTPTNTPGSAPLTASPLPQGSPLSSGRHRQVPSSTSRPRTGGSSNDLFTDVALTDDQKTKIDQIHQDMKSKMDVVARDANSAEWQKGAMIEGLQRMERRQIFQVLTADQQAEVRKKVLAERTAEQKKQQDEKKKQMELMQKQGSGSGQ